MVKKGNRNFIAAAIAAVLLLVISLTAGCTGAKADTVLNMADPGWDSVRFHNEVAGIILEYGYDIKTEVIAGSTPITWQGLIENDIQIYMEAWSDNIATYKDDVEQGRVVELSVNFDDNVQGLYVPGYMINGDPGRGIEPMTPDLKTVEDLKKYPDIFPDPDVEGMGRIYGAISSWEVDNILFKKYEAYGLNEMFTYFRPGSDAAMVAALVSAYESGEPWVGYYWEPTWVSGKYDLVLLEDQPFVPGDDFENGLTEFPPNPVTIVVHPSIEKEYPEAAEMLSLYKTSSALTAEGLAYMNDNDASERESAIWFLKKHDELLSEWVTDADRLGKIRTALEKE